MNRPLVKEFNDYSTITLRFRHKGRHRVTTYTGKTVEVRRICKKPEFNRLTQAQINSAFKLKGKEFESKNLTKTFDAQYLDSTQDKADGPYIQWNENGQLQQAGFFENNKPTGKAFVIVSHKEEGLQPFYAVNTFKNGKMIDSTEMSVPENTANESTEALKQFIKAHKALNHDVSAIEPN